MQNKETIYIYCTTLEEWRNWLRENHLKESSVALILNKKHTGKGTISHLDSMKEAICFGWIDTTIKKLDENQYIRHFRRRTDKSTWSDNTLRYAQEMIKKEKMSHEGLKRYNEGSSKPTLDFGIPKNPNTPADVKKEIIKKNLYKEYKKISKSQKRMYLRTILKSKSHETRNKRISSLIKYLKNK
ncbi:MAG: YdeI/OmpD-associated family protein [Nanoarchaeota archaeon]